ncbi:MAG: winged helix-turn-helix domain-containing protein [Caldilineales bacterium]|nr:winged helix-turn-helix domain-containing protein [Caldilineales bacterium]
MSTSSSRPDQPPPSPGAAYALVDDDLRVQEASAGFWAVVGRRQPGIHLAEVLPAFAGADETLLAVAQGRTPAWELHGVVHRLAPSAAPGYFDIRVEAHTQPAGLLITLVDVTAAMAPAQQEMHRRNASRLASATASATAWAMNHTPTSLDLDTDDMLTICERLGLMMAVVDEQLLIKAATSNFVEYRRRSLAGWPVADVFPSLAGLEDELQSIARAVAPPWRLPGLLLDEDHLRPCDVLIMPHPGQTGLVLAVRQMEAEALAEQSLRQQRNELTLLQEQMERQAQELRKAHDRLTSLDRERRALLDLIVIDIRSALTLVEGYAEWLRTTAESAPAPQSVDALDAIRKNARKVHSLIKDVESIQHIETALTDMRWMPIDLAETMEQIVGMWRDLARLRGVRLDLELKQPLPAIVGDPTLLEEALGVLIDVSLTRTRSQVLLARAHTWDRWVIIRFGVEARASEPASSLRSVRLTDEERVSEFRLARARLIAEGHGGRLSTEIRQSEATRDGQTTSFALWLPVKDESQPARYRLVSESAPAADNGAAASPPIASDLLVVGEGTIRINTTLQRAWVNDELLTLSHNEYRLLVYLAEHADQVVLHDQLRSAMWALDEQISLDTLRVLVWRLRQKLQHPTRRDVQFLRTVRGFGYVLVS